MHVVTINLNLVNRSFNAFLKQPTIINVIKTAISSASIGSVLELSIFVPARLKLREMMMIAP
jgi:hypothetical protein